ncbi:UDP-3-O-(3-hydroxymyristoyl)glucosamine N-acyltransferase [Flavobacteriaceae bacterium UJ101]|nr:UDP-3-O-(3-hydroxymyristoyl)glucosamine N-acyltransferase [Flavobacteriaceae bacterium UJ101]
MKFNRIYQLKEIASLLEVDYVGNDEFPVKGLNEIHVVTEGDIVFVDHPKYYDKALESEATIVLINKKVDCPEGKALLISENPFSDFNKLIEHFNPFQTSNQLQADSAQIGEGTIIQPNVFIGNNVKIGKNCIIHPNVTLYDNTVIGDHVIIHANTVIGSDAFYYKNRTDHFERLKSAGNVVIQDFVEIGASCTIDRGVTASTTIKKHTKLDNQIQIGHDTIIGERCLIASHVGIAGCCIIEDEVTLWGQVGMASGITIGKKAVIQAQSGVSKSLEGGKVYFGYPADEMRTKLRELAAIRKLPELLKKLK